MGGNWRKKQNRNLKKERVNQKLTENYIIVLNTKLKSEYGFKSCTFN